MLVDATGLSALDDAEIQGCLGFYELPHKIYEFDTDISVLCDEEIDSVKEVLSSKIEEYRKEEIQLINKSNMYNPDPSNTIVDDLFDQAKEARFSKEYYEELLGTLEPINF